MKVLLVLGMEEPQILHSVLHYGSNDAARQPAMSHISDETLKLEAVRDNMAATTSTQRARDIREKSKVEKLLPQWEGLWQEIGDKVRNDSTGTMLQHAIPLLKQVLGKLNSVQAKS